MLQFKYIFILQCCAEFAWFTLSEVYCEPYAAWSHYKVSAPPAQEEEASQHQCPVSSNFTHDTLLVKHKANTPLAVTQYGSNRFLYFLQTSLTKLLETLNKAEPFFIRCIRSNAEKVDPLVSVLCSNSWTPEWTFFSRLKICWGNIECKLMQHDSSS